ncbi:MAG: hypothetical protein ACHQUC_06725, partial [Chlamydiales bacterium]
MISTKGQNAHDHFMHGAPAFNAIVNSKESEYRKVTEMAREHVKIAMEAINTMRSNCTDVDIIT